MGSVLSFLVSDAYFSSWHIVVSMATLNAWILSTTSFTWPHILCSSNIILWKQLNFAALGAETLPPFILLGFLTEVCKKDTEKANYQEEVLYTGDNQSITC